MTSGGGGWGGGGWLLITSVERRSYRPSTVSIKVHFLQDRNKHDQSFFFFFITRLVRSSVHQQGTSDRLDEHEMRLGEKFKIYIKIPPDSQKRNQFKLTSCVFFYVWKTWLMECYINQRWIYYRAFDTKPNKWMFKTLH